MSELPPYEQTTGALRKLYDLERSAELLGGILDLDPDVHLRCRGMPSECGNDCVADTCPLQNNRVQDVGSMLAVVLEEFRWHRAWAEELEALQIVPSGTLDRVTIRVKRGRLQDTLKEAVAANEALQGVQVMADTFVTRIAELRAEVEELDARIQGREGVRS